MWWRLNVQESYYTLGGLAQKYIGRSKKDLPYHLLPFRYKTPEGRLEIIQYCVVDTVLTMYLASLKDALVMFMSMSYIQMVDISQKFQSGQGYCALSMLMKEVQKRVNKGYEAYAIPEKVGYEAEDQIQDFSNETEEETDELNTDHSVIKSKGKNDKVCHFLSKQRNRKALTLKRSSQSWT